MPPRMIGIRISITRFVSDDQPGIVECQFSDAQARTWKFIEKSAVVSFESLDAKTSYPRPGVIACKIISRSRDTNGSEVILVDTEHPWGVESVDGAMRFEVFPLAMVEWDWDEGVERPWNGIEEGG
jgi:hypothetical protein